MSTRHQPLVRSRSKCRGMTLTESVVGMLILAVGVGGAMRATAVARLQAIAADDRIVAQAAIDSFRGELVALAYADPESGVSNSIGVESGETQSGPSSWDDIDDAHGWTGSPSVFVLPAGWDIQVAVNFASTADPASTLVSESGLKRLTLNVRRGQRVILQEVVLRANP